MKRFLFSAVLLGLAFPAMAQQAPVVTNAQAVWSAVKYATNCSSTTVGITSAELTGNTTSPANTGGISLIKVSNYDPTNSVCCSRVSTVTCKSGAATDGDLIVPTPANSQPNWLSWPISIAQTWYCIATAASVGIEVCKAR